MKKIMQKIPLSQDIFDPFLKSFFSKCHSHTVTHVIKKAEIFDYVLKIRILLTPLKFKLSTAQHTVANLI